MRTLPASALLFLPRSPPTRIPHKGLLRSTPRLPSSGGAGSSDRGSDHQPRRRGIAPGAY
eukprot:1790446-Rhodomonas_salina.1